MARPKKVKGTKKKTPNKPPRARAAKPKKDGLTTTLLSAIDQMQDMSPGTIAEVHDAPQHQLDGAWRTPWRLACRFILPKGTLYDDLFVVLRDWRDDKSIRGTLGPSRLSRILVRYIDSEGRGDHGEYPLSEISSWDLAISRATEKVGVRDDRRDSLIARYGNGSKHISFVESLIVWLSPWTTKDIKLGKAKKHKS